MSEAEIVQAAPQEAIIPSESEVRLGSLSIHNPVEIVKTASEIATALADIINQKELYSIIPSRGKKLKYVRCEGWTTMGAMLGVVPIEEYCRPLPDNKGFEAKVKLLRVKDGGQVGAASAECTYDEDNWSDRDSYSLRSMSLTRATSKAFRLSFSWIIKLAGFEPTPAEEMMQSDGSTRLAQEVGERKVKELRAKADVVEAVFYVWYEESQTAKIMGSVALLERFGLKKYYEKTANAIVLTGQRLEDLKYECEQAGVPIKQLQKAI